MELRQRSYPQTYFIGGCVFAFPNLYRKWSTERAALQYLTSIEYDTVDRSNPPQDPGEMAVTQLHIREGFNNIPDDRTKSAILLQEMGYTTPRSVRYCTSLLGPLMALSGATQRGGGRHD